MDKQTMRWAEDECAALFRDAEQPVDSKVRRTVKAILAQGRAASVVVLAASTLAACHTAAPGTKPASPAPAPAPSSTEGDDGAGDLAGYPEWRISCGEGGELLEVEPDTPATREAAKARCAKDEDAINDAPWPSGWRPTTLPGAP